MKKRMFVCFFIFTVCLFHLSITDTAFSQGGTAADVFERYNETFRNPDVHAFFPDVLGAFKTPDIQAVLNSIIINNFTNDPKSIRSFHQNVDDSIVVLLTIDEDFRALFRDEQFHIVLQNPTEIDKLVELVEGTTPRPRENDCEIPPPDPPKATTLTIVSGYGQEGQPGARLTYPFVVIVRDQYGNPFSGNFVTFRVTKGEGSLPQETVTPTGGEAKIYLTLGSNAGANWVEASVAGITQRQTFTAIASVESPEPISPFDADVNGDDIVSPIDLSIVFTLITNPNSDIAEVDADINNDGIVDEEDLILIASALGSIAAAPSIRALRQEGISARDVQEMLTQAKALPEVTQADPVYQRGIVVLERLLAILTKVRAVPKKNALLPNYPNPFNPETWIPYGLSEAADVEVSIYAVNGRLVRKLALGHQPAGLYQRKSRAAYWDGRNDFGERVASGLYFYTLTAGKFTATRKMLIRK